MSSYFCLSFHFLDSSYHGLGDGDKAEWPPSPLRAFQSVVAAAAARQRLLTLAPALKWLEQQAAPIVVAPIEMTTPDRAPGYCLSVPNNALDIVAKAWCRGNYSNSGDANPATHRTMKVVRPVMLPDSAAVHYLWHLSDLVTEEVRNYVAMLSDIARSTVALGWGVDMVVGHGEVIPEEQANTLAGERWSPSTSPMEEGLRMPVKGTLDALIQRHECFLNRLDSNGFTPPPPLSAYDKVDYRRATDPQLRDVAAFSLRKLDASGFRAFNTTQTALTVAGMMRHATSLAAENAGWSKSDINTFILGHAESHDDKEHAPVGPQRFAYLPLPSIESRGRGKARVVSSIRRVLLTTLADGNRSKITWAKRALSGQELIDEKKKESVALLTWIPASEKVVQYYLRPAASWSTVTPVVLPGYDDPAHYRRRLKAEVGADEQKQLLNRLDHRIDSLLRKAISQAGIPKDLADNAILEWRKVGFWAGTELADLYGAPQHLKRFSRFHVRVQWYDANRNPVKISGPICIGGGRFYGLGLFAAEGD